MIITNELASKLSIAEADAFRSRFLGLQQIDGNPMGIEICQFGSAVGFVSKIIKDQPFNRILCLSDDDIEHAAKAISWQREQGSAPSVEVSPYATDGKLLAVLSANGLKQTAFGTVLVAEIEKLDISESNISGVEICKASRNVDAFKTFVAIALEAYGWPDFVGPNLTAQFLQANWHDYYASVDGTPAGIATMHVRGEIASFVTAITKTDYRGRGCQTALINQRLSDARNAGCKYATVQTSPGSISQRNLERAGFQVAFTRATWAEG